MKPGYKIIIAGLIIYGGVKIVHHIEVSPYVDRIKIFMNDLKGSRFFDAQGRLGIDLQEYVSVDKLMKFKQDNNLSGYKDISLNDWESKDGNYTLQGDIVYGNGNKEKFVSVLRKDNNDTVEIEKFVLKGYRLMPNSSELSQ